MNDSSKIHQVEAEAEIAKSASEHAVELSEIAAREEHFIIPICSTEF